jgi:hypothetical protein
VAFSRLAVLRLMQLLLLQRYTDAVDTASDALRVFGEEMPASGCDHTAVLCAEMAEVRRLPGARSLAHIATCRSRGPSTPSALFDLLRAVGSACFRACPRLWPWVSVRKVHLKIEHGVRPDTASAESGEACSRSARVPPPSLTTGHHELMRLRAERPLC